MLHLLAAVLLSTSADTTVVDKAADPVVCKKSKLPAVGTRLKAAPVCKRKSEWDLDRQTTQRELQQINERGNNPGRQEGR